MALSDFLDAPSGLGIASSALGFLGQERANAQNKDMWRKTQDWTEMMSNTAWQRGVADMRKAGVNPMLAFSKGGASSPTGQIGSPMQDSIGKGAATGLQAYQLSNATRLNDAQIAETKSRIALNAAQAISASANSAKNQATKPIYDLIRDIVSSGTSSARRFGKNASKSGTYSMSRFVFGK